jgi:YfiH family protein
VGDDPALVDENWSILRKDTGLTFARVKQVHGDRVFRVPAAEGPEGPPEADGVVSDRSGTAACVLVADCVPILLADPRSGAVAALHAGWRGTLAGVGARGVEAMVREVGARPEELLAAIGPSIGPCCYEVSSELAERFRERWGERVGNPSARQPRVDLWLANRLTLQEAGLALERVEVLERCTSCEEELFFSHRRDSGRTGRQAAFIAPK